MSKEKKLEAGALDDFINKLRDINGVIGSLVEKIAKVQFEADEAGAKFIADPLGKVMGSASDDGKVVAEVLQKVEAEKSNLAG